MLAGKLRAEAQQELRKRYEVVEKLLERTDSGVVSEQEKNPEQEIFEEKLNLIKISREEVLELAKAHFTRTGEKPDDKLMKELVRKEKIARLNGQNKTEEQNNKEKDLAKAKAELDGILAQTKIKQSAANGAESKEEKDVEFEKLCEEFQEDFAKGETGYKISTKIPPKQTFRGYSETRDERVSVNYENYVVLSNLEGGHAGGGVYFKDGESIKKNELVGSSVTFGQFGTYDKEIGDSLMRGEKWTKEGNAILLTTQITKGKDREGVKVGDYAKDSERKNEELYSLFIKYAIDNAMFPSETRGDFFATLGIAVRRDLAIKISEAIKNDPQKIWDFIKSVEPRLLEVSPPANKTKLGKQGLVVLKEDRKKDIKVLPWDKEVVKHEMGEFAEKF